MKRFLQAVALLAVFSVSPSARAVKFGMPFTDGAVLQRDRPISVWGMADPNEPIKVTLGRDSRSETADAQGRWKVELPPQAATKQARELVVVGCSGESRIKDVVVGEVWLASGQSNMEMQLWGKSNLYRDLDGSALIQYVRRPYIRYLQTANNKWSAKPVSTNEAVWTSLTPKNVGKMSAVAFYFAETLNRELDIPIGIIGAFWGGTNIDAWIPREGLSLHPDLSASKYEVSSDWNSFVKQGPIVSALQQPTVLYNAQIAPIVPYALRGAIWYQGCQNTNSREDAETYCDRMHALYDGWKTVFSNPGLRLYFVEIAQFDSKHFENWLQVQFQQMRFAREEHNSGIVITSDVKSWKDVHPHSKYLIGRRLAMLAMKRDYGFDEIICDSPEVKEATLMDNGDVRLDFSRKTGGWYVYRSDWTTDVSFELRDSEGKWFPAAIRNMHAPTRYWDGLTGTVEDDYLIVGWNRSEHLYAPTGVRYMCLPDAKGDLLTADGLPVGPFEFRINDIR